MKDVDRCLMCEAAIPEGTGVCKNCMTKAGIEAGEAAEIAEEMRDIAGVLSITANTDGNIKKSMESILRIADRLERKGNEERSRTKVIVDETVMKAIYEAEQLYPGDKVNTGRNGTAHNVFKSDGRGNIDCRGIWGNRS